VLDYVTHHAYASTARVLAQPRSSTSTVSDGKTNTNGTGASSGDGVIPVGNGEGGEDKMDIDETTTFGEGSAVQKDRNRERLITESELASIEKRRGESSFIAFLARLHFVCPFLTISYPRLYPEWRYTKSRRNAPTPLSRCSRRHDLSNPIGKR